MHIPLFLFSNLRFIGSSSCCSFRLHTDYYHNQMTGQSEKGMESCKPKTKSETVVIDLKLDNFVTPASFPSLHPLAACQQLCFLDDSRLRELSRDSKYNMGICNSHTITRFDAVHVHSAKRSSANVASN